MVLQLVGIQVALGQEAMLVKVNAVQQLDVGVIDQRVGERSCHTKNIHGFLLVFFHRKGGTYQEGQSHRHNQSNVFHTSFCFQKFQIITL